MAYDWRQDAIECWKLAIHWKAITGGYKRPARPLEVYWAEAKGCIP